MSPTVSLGDPINDTDGSNNEWLVDRERQQTNIQLALLQEQLQSEKSSRVESEVINNNNNNNNPSITAGYHWGIYGS